MTQKEILDLAHHNTLFSQLLSLIPGHSNSNYGDLKRRLQIKELKIEKL